MEKFIINYRSNPLRGTKGFTLIELLVVIAVIGILASVMVANFVNVRYKTRDGVRKKDMEQIRLALETYRVDQSQYPASLYTSAGDCTGTDDLVSGPTTYMTDIPCDPLDPDDHYNYVPSGSTPRLQYTLHVCLENSNDTGPNVQNVTVGTGANQCPSGKRLELANP